MAEAATKEAEELLMKIGQDIQNAAQAGGADAGQQAQQNTSGSNDQGNDDVQDVDFEEVK
jgi:hypothetical protein